jgi:hypothetical protein
MDDIRIKISGRIPKYFFGTLNQKYRNELEEALTYCNGEIETEQDFLYAILKMTLEDSENAREEFLNIITKENLQRLTNFNRLVNQIIEGDWNHFELIDDSDFFTCPDYNNGYITMFEGDSHITIFKNDEEILEEMKLSDFVKDINSWSSDVDSETESTFKDMQEFINSDKNNFDGEDYFTWWINEQGVYFLSGWFTPPTLNKFVQESRIESKYNSGGQLSIYFDDITDYIFEIQDENFDFSKLTFVRWEQCDQFRNSAYSTEFNLLYYNNEIIYPYENWWRDKGISLSYEDETLDYLLNA